MITALIKKVAITVRIVRLLLRNIIIVILKLKYLTKKTVNIYQINFLSIRMRWGRSQDCLSQEWRKFKWNRWIWSRCKENLNRCLDRRSRIWGRGLDKNQSINNCQHGSLFTLLLRQGIIWNSNSLLYSLSINLTISLN